MFVTDIIICVDMFIEKTIKNLDTGLYIYILSMQFKNKINHWYDPN